MARFPTHAASFQDTGLRVWVDRQGEARRLMTVSREARAWDDTECRLALESPIYSHMAYCHLKITGRSIRYLGTGRDTIACQVEFVDRDFDGVVHRTQAPAVFVFKMGTFQHVDELKAKLRDLLP